MQQEQIQSQGTIIDVSDADMQKFQALEAYLGQQVATSPNIPPQFQTAASSPLIEKLKNQSNLAPTEIPGVQKIRMDNNSTTPPSLSNLNQFGQPQPAQFNSELFGGNGATIQQQPIPQVQHQMGVPEQYNRVAQQFQSQPLVVENVVQLSQQDFSQLTPETQKVAQQMQAQNPAFVQRIAKNIKIFEVNLPSGGMYYPEGNTFRGLQKVQMRKILNRDDDIIRSSKLLNEGKAFTTLIKNLLIDKNLDPMDLFDGDLWSLLINARNQAYGQYYNPGLKYECDFCHAEFENDFDLSNLGRIMPDPQYRHVDNIFETKLPSSELTVLIKVFTNKDTEILNTIITAANRQMVNDKIDRTESTTTRQHLVAVEGETDPVALNDFCDHWLDVADKLYILEFSREMEPRLKFTQDVMCPDCHSTMSERRIPMTERLFSPKFVKK